MNEADNKNVQSGEVPVPRDQETFPESEAARVPTGTADRTSNHRWWIQLFLQPALFLACGVILLAGLGVAQRAGLISAGQESGPVHVHARDEDVLYICPMMCTPPRSAPGRCPVCGMELVPTTASGVQGDSHSIQLEPAARRVANIHTVAVRAVPMSRTIRAIGELSYDEGSLKTIAAYVDGRLEKLYADYTGVVVQKGDRLALLYSPSLYSNQVELLLARQARDSSRAAALARVIPSSHDLYENMKRRLIELGVTEEQINELEKAGEPSSRIHLYAPISGTVIEKQAVEGQYVKEGDAIYKLADLSSVWLMLKLFPEDAAAVRFGQKVEAQVQSLTGQTFAGRIAFIDPNVDPQTRTVGVRVVMPNDEGLLRIGDYAKATIQVPVGGANDRTAAAYDPELANKWISPRHPHVIEAEPGQCRVCGVDLVPAAQFGFTDEPVAGSEALVLPRGAVLMAGGSSVVYVETAPGRFEIRHVELGPTLGGEIAIRSGVAEGEQVATRGNFLIDSQMQLAGNPSLIDPANIVPPASHETPDRVAAALASLSPEDRRQAESQEICPVTEMRLGSMGTPLKVDVRGTPIFICCGGCRQNLLAEPDRYLAKLAEGRTPPAATGGEVEMHLPPIGPMERIGPSRGPANGKASEPIQGAAQPEDPAPAETAKQATFRQEAAR
jgi:Cu(I)/Ag(I) efflux system membrane fusion protein